MTPAQENHLSQIKEQFNQLVDVKFRKGAEEHGGDLLRDFSVLNIIDAAIEEAIDLVTYLLSARMKLTGEGKGTSECTG